MPDNHIEAVLNFIFKNDDFLLTTHINADGDAIASVLACSLFLEQLNKKYLILLHDQEIDSKYKFLENWNKIQSFKNEQKELYRQHINSVLIFDAPGKQRIGDVATLLSDEIRVIKIDHHQSEENFSPDDWVDKNASSASAMLYDIIVQSPVKINLEIAQALYTGIIYDTGRLSFSNTRGRDFEICAHLVKCGANPAITTNNLFFNNNVNTLQIIGYGLISLKQYQNNKISIIHLDHNKMKDVSQNEAEELANYSVSVAGTEVGVYIREVEPEYYKISLRSKNNVDVSKVAGKFNGGGHKKAAGCRFNGKYDDLVKQITKEIARQF